jgi:hypothetical protein
MKVTSISIMGTALLFLLLASLTANAELSRQERESAKNMIAGTLYLRLDVPCRYGRGRFGISAAIHHLESLLEVSPTGHSTERKLGLPSKYKRASVFWGLSPNGPVRYGKLLFNGDTVQVWMEGIPPNDSEMILDFIEIHNLNDFTKAYNQTFSRIPLQDEHPEWTSDVRLAIAARRVVLGMTKEQAFDVVGSPLNITSLDDNGVKMETWFPRQDRSTVVAARPAEGTPTGFPALLKFTAGVLQTIEDTHVTPESKGNR